MEKASSEFDDLPPLEQITPLPAADPLSPENLQPAELAEHVPQERFFFYPPGVRSQKDRAEYFANAVKRTLGDSNPGVTAYSRSRREAVQMLEAFKNAGIRVTYGDIETGETTDTVRGVGLNVGEHSGLIAQANNSAGEVSHDTKNHDFPKNFDINDIDD